MFKIALGGLAALALVVTIAISRWSSPVGAAESDQPPFEETWRDAAMPLVFRSAALASITAPKIVQVEPVKMEPDVVMLPDPPESKPVAKRKPRHVELDVCRGKAKRYHGRSWKCRR